MKKIKFFIWAVIIVLLIYFNWNSFKTPKQTVSGHAANPPSEIIIYSMIPYRKQVDKEYKSIGNHYGYHYFQERTISDPKIIKEILKLVDKGMRDNSKSGSKCFWPRHGIKVGGDIMVICFECSWNYVNNKPAVISRDVMERINEIWVAQGMKVAPNVFGKKE